MLSGLVDFLCVPGLHGKEEGMSHFRFGLGIEEE